MHEAEWIQGLGKVLFWTGAALASVGLLLWMFGGWSWLGRLPGDLVIRRERFTLYVPLATSLLLSLVLTLLLNLLSRR